MRNSAKNFTYQIDRQLFKLFLSNLVSFLSKMPHFLSFQRATWTKKSRNLKSGNAGGDRIITNKLIKYPVMLTFRYDISNCLFQAAYEKVLEECQCTPYFHWGGDHDFCRGKTLKCMNNILERIGQYNTVDGKPCLASCEDQKNSVSITTSR